MGCGIGGSGGSDGRGGAVHDHRALKSGVFGVVDDDIFGLVIGVGSDKLFCFFAVYGGILGAGIVCEPYLIKFLSLVFEMRVVVAVIVVAVVWVEVRDGILL